MTSAPEGQGAPGDPIYLQQERLRRAILDHFPRDTTENVSRLEMAIADAAEHHKGQFRKSGEPVIMHPLRVALLASEAGLDLEAVIIALLHDVVEDTPVTKAQVQRRYGKGVAQAVDGLTKVATSTRQGLGRESIDTYRKLLSSTVRDIRTLQVKIFDRLDNMRDLGFLSRERQRRISMETFNVYVPMAQRMGLMDISRELTTLCFRYLYPKRFKQTLEQLKQCVRQEKRTVTALRNTLSTALTEFGLRRFRVEPRYADVSDFIVEREPPTRALQGFSAVVSSSRDCYVAVGALHTKYRAVPHSIRDYISNPKPNRYQALESEIFIGNKPVSIWAYSAEMEAVNRSGILVNWNKSRHELSKYYKSYVELIDQYDTGQELRMEDVLRHAQLESLQTFTPKGNLLTFPHEATVLDFAFAIHTDLGLQCCGAIVAGTDAAPFDALVDGAMVEVLTDPGVSPTPEWLEHVRTTKARLAIRRFLRTQALSRAEEVGRRLLDVEVRRLDKDSDSLLADRRFRTALKESRLDLPRFYQQIGTGILRARTFLLEHNLISKKEAAHLTGEDRSLLQRYLAPMFRASHDPDLWIPEQGNEFIQLARCCSPLRGDAIVGVQGAQMLTVHRTMCPELEAVPADRLLSVDWEQVEDKTAYHLKIVAEDRLGLIYKIGKVMRRLKVNIKDLHTDREADRDGLAEINIVLEPITAKTYTKVVSRLRGIKEVVKLIDGRSYWVGST
ncbi:MAG: bifunctional (p)ppGpp synthetase/guanosine-3',5'-bis(diphosphate) 3'-pyrophosphohydrolase [Candidatus Lambdaproteobacteria bacterium]|nr:bifunctional (p)ppGpp synthetase/guanosine-3',5'-bis(diphosphate) 3'-pyrophosphohydrolase [Candidatus Lambdaproteobacteria bacterium]